MSTQTMPISDLRRKTSDRASLQAAAAEPPRPSPAQRYPTVAPPASSLNAWKDLIPEGCGGDALADAEALYDEV